MACGCVFEKLLTGRPRLAHTILVVLEWSLIGVSTYILVRLDADSMGLTFWLMFILIAIAWAHACYMRLIIRRLMRVGQPPHR